MICRILNGKKAAFKARRAMPSWRYCDKESDVCYTETI